MSHEPEPEGHQATPAPPSEPTPASPSFVPADYPPPAPDQLAASYGPAFQDATHRPMTNAPWSAQPATSAQYGWTGEAGGQTPPPGIPGHTYWDDVSRDPTPPRPRRHRGITVLVAVVAIAMMVLAGPLYGWLGSTLRPLVPGWAPSSGSTATDDTSGSPALGPSGPVGAPIGPAPEQSAATTDQIRGVAIVEAALSATRESAGTGIVIDATGIVITNYHVVAGNNGTIRVTVAATGTVYSATVLGHDPANDIALLRLRGASDLPTVTIDADPVSRGDTVTAVGNSGGSGTIMAGAGRILSTDQTITVTDEDTPEERQLSGLYETSSRALRGDSGGPTYDAQTEVIGLTTAGTDETEARSLAYVIPIAKALDIAGKISRNEPSGSITMGP